MNLRDRATWARNEEQRLRLTRALAVRAMMQAGSTQQQVANELGISQPAVSQTLKTLNSLNALHPAELLAGAAPVIKDLAEQRGFADIAVFGSVARGEAHQGSDIDFLVRAPKGAQISDVIELKRVLADLLGRDVDVVTVGGLKPGRDDYIHRDAIAL